MQAELQSEGDALAEGEDAVVEEAAVTGILPCSPLCSCVRLTTPAACPIGCSGI